MERLGKVRWGKPGKAEKGDPEMVYEKKYSWRAGHGRVSPEAAGQVMESIEERDGAVTAQSFLDESRPEDSPTHGCFEWNDYVAAEKYRLHQSHKAILDLVVTIKSDDKTVRKPAFVNVNTRGKASYNNVMYAFSVEENKKNVLANALKELESFKQKYASLAEMEEVIEAINEVERKYK